MSKQGAVVFNVNWQAIERLRRRLTARAQRVTRCRAAAEDCVQAALTRVLEQRPKLSSNINIQAWLSIVVWHLAIDHTRKRRRELPSSSLLEEQPTAESEESTLGDEHSGLWKRVSHEQLDAALQACGPKLREAYLLHCQEGLSYSDVARTLDIPLRTAGSRIHRARAALRAHLVQSLTASVKCHE